MRIALLSDGSNFHTLRWAEYFHDSGDELLLLTMEEPREMPIRSLRLGPRRQRGAGAAGGRHPGAGGRCRWFRARSGFR